MPQAAGPPQPGTANQQPQIADLFFPISGVDVSVALENQTPDTTPEGLNVRAFDPTTNRARGGRRPGISKYIPAQPSGFNLIQHLQVVVDPQAIALGVSYPPIGGGFPPLQLITPPGFVIYGGGSGFPPAAPPNVLIVTAKNQTKVHGNTFTFNGTEFTTTGLQAGDQVTSAQFQCAGSPASASTGSYPINLFNPQISYGSAHTGPPYYYLTAPGTMNVTPHLTQTTAALTGDNDGPFSQNGGIDTSGNWSLGGFINVGVFAGDMAHAIIWSAQGNINTGAIQIQLSGSQTQIPGTCLSCYFDPSITIGGLVDFGTTFTNSLSTGVYLNIGVSESLPPGGAVKGSQEGAITINISFS